MKRLPFVMLLVICSYTNADQFPADGEELLQGCKDILVIKKHDCGTGKCKDHEDEAIRSLATFSFVRGFLSGVRTSQAVGDSPRLVDLPEKGVDANELIEPLVEFLEKNPELREDHITIALYYFLMKRYPAESNRKGPANKTN